MAPTTVAASTLAPASAAIGTAGACTFVDTVIGTEKEEGQDRLSVRVRYAIFCSSSASIERCSGACGPAFSRANERLRGSDALFSNEHALCPAVGLPSVVAPSSPTIEAPNFPFTFRD